MFYTAICDDEALYATLLRGVAYCAHPIGTMPLIKRNIFIPYVEQGRRTFRFRFSYDAKTALENNAQEFVNTPFALNFFPHGEGKAASNVLKVENTAISLVAFYKDKEGYILRFVNNNETAQTTKISLRGKSYEIAFGKHEAKTFVFDGAGLTEKEIWV